MDANTVVRVLSLSGGGARGIYQARFLDRLEREYKKRIAEIFDVVAGTSTGAIIAALLANGVSAQDIVTLFRSRSSSIFQKKRFAFFRRGSLYNNEPLVSIAIEKLHGCRFRDLKTRLLITATTIESHEGRIFCCETDSDILVSDAVLSSAAAPIFFTPHRSTADINDASSDTRAYYDGGLWANDPSEEVLRYCRKSLGVTNDQIRLISLGNGVYTTGSMVSRLEKMRPISKGCISTLVEMSSSLQIWRARRVTEEQLNPSHYLFINSALPTRIALDDVIMSNAILPSLAEGEYDRVSGHIMKTLDSHQVSTKPIEGLLAEGIRIAGMTRFIPSRKYYSKYRVDASTITEYCLKATQTLDFVSINLKTGHSLENILDCFKDLIMREDGRSVKVRLSVLDPEKDYLMKAVCSNMNIPPDDLSSDIKRLKNRITEWHKTVDWDCKDNFQFYFHKTIPSASAIIIDGKDPRGTIQLETNSYKSPAVASFGFEIKNGSDLYATLVKAYNKLLQDATRVV